MSGVHAGEREEKEMPKYRALAMFIIFLIIGLVLLIHGMGVIEGFKPRGWHGLYVSMGLFLLGFPFSISLKVLNFSPKVIVAMWVAYSVIIAAVVATNQH